MSTVHVWFAVVCIAMMGCGTATAGDDAGSDARGPACTHATDCADDLVCIGGACEPRVSCASSRMCPGLVCNTTLGACAECATAADCGDNERCLDGVCELPCTSACDAGAIDGGPPDAYADDASAPDDSGHDAGAIDAGHDAAVTTHDTGVAPTWEVLPSTGWPVYAGFVDTLPAGETGIYAVSRPQDGGSSRYDLTTHTWTRGADPLLATTDIFLAGPAWVENALYVMMATNVYRYDTTGDVWATMRRIRATSQSQCAHDDVGHVYALSSDNYLLSYDVATDTIFEQSLGLMAPATVPRVAWDTSSARLYIVSSITAPNMVAVDPLVGTITPTAQIPGATTFAPLFCGDRTGHIFGTTSTIGDALLWQYDTATNEWTRMPDMPFAHGQNGECLVSDDGYLYVTADQPNMARIRVR